MAGRVGASRFDNRRLLRFRLSLVFKRILGLCFLRLPLFQLGAQAILHQLGSLVAELVTVDYHPELAVQTQFYITLVLQLFDS